VAPEIVAGYGEQVQQPRAYNASDAPDFGDLTQVDAKLLFRANQVDDWMLAGRKSYPARLKYCTARSCFSAAARVLNVPRFFRLPDLASFFRE
jgi:hypothetical protein